MSQDPEELGRRILRGFDEGRQIAIEQRRRIGEENERLVRIELDKDILEGNLKRGRPGRISRALHGRLSERLVAKILARLSCGADSAQ